MKNLSIIICKYDSVHFKNCIRSIEETQTAEYELIIIDNSSNKYDLFTAYNEGIKRSTGKYLCFMHEDVSYYEYGWMDNVFTHFEKDPQVGMIGVAGGASYNMFPRFWGTKGNCASSLMSASEKGEYKHVTKGLEKETKQALIVDGLWFCVRKELLEEYNISFDIKTFKGFHRYDYDLSFQLAQYSKILIVQDVKVAHYSSGSRNKEWLKASLDFHYKWQSILPCKIEDGVIGITKLEKSDADVLALISFIVNMKKLNFSRKEIKQVINQASVSEVLNLSRLIILKLTLLPYIVFIPYSIIWRAIYLIQIKKSLLKFTLIK